MSKATEPSPTLLDELEAIIYEYAEYSHPCDADEKRLGNATGTVSIHVLKELLDKHKGQVEG
jgi:hypothetical protein